jgi:tRNA uridine 5-carboxymethylaminomethyl modification enzyme
LVDSARWNAFNEKLGELGRLRRFAETTDIEGIKLAGWLRRPENNVTKLAASIRSSFDSKLWDIHEIDLKYEGYIMRQNIAIDRLRRHDDKKLPRHLDYLNIHGLRTEARHKLSSIRPETLGQASRISGVTPADLALLAVWIERDSCG